MTLIDDLCDGCGSRFDPMGDPNLTKHPEIGPYAVFCARCEEAKEAPMAETDPIADEACGCYACVGDAPISPESWLTVGMTRMILCPECGNKRCPHSTDHRLACTGSNEPGQDGSRYPDPRTRSRLTADEFLALLDEEGDDGNE